MNKINEIIPDELIWEMFLFLELKDIYNCFLVCKRFYQINKNPIFWKDVAIIFNPFFEKENRSKEGIKKFIKKIFKFNRMYNMIERDIIINQSRELLGYFLKLDKYQFINFKFEPPLKFKDDKEVVLAAVKQKGYSLVDANDKLKDDKEVVLAAVKQHGYALRFASNRLKDDKEVVLAAVKKYGWALKYSSDKLKDDKDVVLAAIKENGWALQYASEKLKDDKEVVLVAVKQNGYALQSDELKDDKEIVLAAVKNSIWVLQFASDRLKNNYKIVFVSVKNNGLSLQFASNNLKNDKELQTKGCSY